MAEVHAATDQRTGRPAAVKVLHAVGADAAVRFDRELVALESLDHPAIVRLLDHGVHDDAPFLVLERVEGGSLADRLRDGPLGVDAATALGAVLADALAHAHGRGIVHRDVSPGNVLLDGDDQPHLADFGIARLVGAAPITRTGWMVGTASYIAPEQVHGGAVGSAADVYSLGLVMLECATGTREYPGGNRVAALAHLLRPPEIPASLPPGLAAVLRSMTAAEPIDRPAAGAVAASLRALAAGDDLTMVAPALTPRVAIAAGAPPWSRYRVAAGAALLAALAGLGAVAWADGGSSDPTAATTTTTATTVATTAPPPPTTAAPPDTRPPPGERGDGNDRRDERDQERDDD
jgi:serine/threonine protein kinase